VPVLVLCKAVQGGGTEGYCKREHFQALSGQPGIINVDSSSLGSVSFSEGFRGSHGKVSSRGRPSESQEGANCGHVRKVPGATFQQSLAKSGTHLPDSHFTRTGQAGVKSCLKHHSMVVCLVGHLGSRARLLGFDNHEEQTVTNNAEEKLAQPQQGKVGSLLGHQVSTREEGVGGDHVKEQGHNASSHQPHLQLDDSLVPALESTSWQHHGEGDLQLVESQTVAARGEVLLQQPRFSTCRRLGSLLSGGQGGLVGGHQLEQSPGRVSEDGTVKLTSQLCQLAEEAGVGLPEAAAALPGGHDHPRQALLRLHIGSLVETVGRGAPT